MSVLHQFRGPHGGFGLNSYNNARAAGLNPKQIAAAIGSSGMSLGYRARDAIISDTARQAEGLKQQRNQAQSASQAYQAQIDEYNSKLEDYRTQLDDYQSRFTDLTGQYNEALGSANKFEEMFNEKSAQYEFANNEAQRYRDEAVGRQLQSIRSGATSGGANQTQAGIASLSAGRAGIRSADDSAVEIEKNIQAESGALTGKGPVVQRIQAAQPSSRTSSNQRQGNPAGTSSYYASRFR